MWQDKTPQRHVTWSCIRWFISAFLDTFVPVGDKCAVLFSHQVLSYYVLL